MRASLLAVAVVFASGFAIADGGRLRAYEEVGDFRVGIFTEPEPLVAGAADLSVLVQSRQSGATLLGADVTLVLAGPNGASLAAAAAPHAANRLLYGARVDLSAGRWAVAVRIRHHGASAEARATLDVGRSDGSPSPWPYLAIPPVAVALFAANRRLRRRRLGVAALSLLVLGSATGCSYLKWRQTKAAERAELKKSPHNLLLEKDYAPQDCFVLTGRIASPESGGPLLVAALDHGGGHAIVGSREVISPSGDFGLLLPKGRYDVVYCADLDRDGFYEEDEVVGRTAEDAPVDVDASRASEGLFVTAPDVRIDVLRPEQLPVGLRIKVVSRPFVVESVDDPLFDPQMGELGVYQPNAFLAHTQSTFFSMGTPDFSKVQLILVHGINGTPRDFRDLIQSLDRSRYHVWLFYYPSGLALGQLGMVLARGIERVAAEPKLEGLRLAVVAHSMGGLVGRRAINELCRKGRPPYLLLFASFDTPYGGVEAAASPVRKGIELIPSWIDVAAGSPFLTRLHATPLPKDLPFHLFFGWGETGRHGPGPAGDGTITLASQLDPRAQAVATGMSGYGQTHVGILSDEAALAELSRVLDATCADNGAAR